MIPLDILRRFARERVPTNADPAMSQGAFGNLYQYDKDLIPSRVDPQLLRPCRIARPTRLLSRWLLLLLRLLPKY